MKVSFTLRRSCHIYSKVEFLREAKRQGYKTYLYYVSTVDPQINTARVRVSRRTVWVVILFLSRKSIERYYRSMDLLMQAIECCDRAYLFDNSSDGIQASFLLRIEDS